MSVSPLCSHSTMSIQLRWIYIEIDPLVILWARGINHFLSDSVSSHTANSSLWRLRIERDARFLPQHLCLGSKDDFPGTSSASSKRTREFELAERKWRQRCFSTKINRACFINGTSIETVYQEVSCGDRNLKRTNCGIETAGTSDVMEKRWRE
jgi:hypothetical protein